LACLTAAAGCAIWPTSEVFALLQAYLESSGTPEFFQTVFEMGLLVAAALVPAPCSEVMPKDIPQPISLNA
jgi:hypothetical protein